jgi:CheY-like chemotaxis protein
VSEAGQNRSNAAAPGKHSTRDGRRSAPKIRPQKAKPTILWIDDYAPGLAIYKATFQALGFRVLIANEGWRGLQLASCNNLAAAITDYEMPGMNGGVVAASLKRLNPRVPVIMFSGSKEIPGNAKLCIDAFCDKCGRREDLPRTLWRLIRSHSIGSFRTLPVPNGRHKQRTIA